MESVVENISVTKKRLTIEAAASEVEGEVVKSLNEVRMKSRLPGFRPGKAPLSLIEKKYRKDVEADVVERLVTQYYNDALKSANLRALTQPVVESRNYESRGGIKLVVSFEVRPPIEGLSYEGLPLKAVKTEITDEEMETYLKRIAVNKATYAPVDRPIELEDLVVADYVVVDDGKTYDDQFIKIGAGVFPDEFYKALTGKIKGDAVEVKVPFPDTYPNPELKGREVDLKVTIKEVKALSTPEVDDELAKDYGFDDLQSLKKVAGENLLAAKTDRAKKEEKAQLIKALIEKYDFELPETLLKQEIDAIIRQARTVEAYKDVTDEQLKEKFAFDAKNNVKVMVLMDAIGELEDINVSEDEMRERILMLGESSSMSPEALIQYFNHVDGSLDGIRYTIFREKVVDAIHKKAKVTEEES
ncbi:trigger factor [Candidatus Magnetomonas plexicatena]|uniref:trigger factor n=1 Tax=Candidatus Magnetomonas plexicatena TaxID=2552947 RepID=UPI001C77E163|nr:trigger factor [Nitrospirales bacterium LBB_01]